MKKRAVIVGTMHPKGLMRAQVRVLPDWNNVDDADLPWAEYLMPIGDGFVPTITGDLVWIEFPYTGNDGEPDTRWPLIVGAAETAPGGVPNVAPEASGQGSPYQPPATDGAPARPATSKTKDFVLHRNNLLEIRTAGGGYEITNTSANASIGINEAGQFYFIGPADMVINVGGNATVKAKGNVDVTAKGNASLTSEGKIDLTAESDVTVKAGGAFSVTAASLSFEQG